MTPASRRALARRVGVTVTVLLILGAIVFTILVMNRRYEASLHPSQEIPWLASQLETEYLRMSHALQLYMLEGGVAHSEVVLRFEVYWSRVELMAQGARFAGFEEGTWKTLGPMLRASLAELDSIVADPAFHRTVSGRLAIENHLAMWPELHGFSQEAIRFIWTRNALQQRHAMVTVVTTLAAVLILVVIVAGILVVMARKQSTLARSERRSKEIAEASIRQRERFMASMSHELRTPLNAIIGFSEVMTLGTMGPLEGKYREYAEDILKSGRHLLGLVNQVLDLSSIGARDPELTLSRFRISDVLDDCLAMVLPLSRAKGLTAGVDIQQDFEIEADAQKFRQIVVNLLSNAIKFTPEDGAISVALRANVDGDIEVAVIDSGIGMTDEVRSQVFDPYFRSADPYVLSSEGTGLGLAISREVANQLGFTLNLESTPGQGTIAILLIPAKRGRKVARKTADDRAAPDAEPATGNDNTTR